MADTPFLGEIKLMSFNFPPKGWAFCNGQFLSIAQNQPLFALLGTMYGGNGQTTFALPDLRGRVPIHFTGGHTQGAAGGEQAHTVNISEMPAHTHTFGASQSNANTPVPANNLFGTSNNMYAAATSLTSVNASTITSVGGSQPHQNMQPYLTLNFCIALIGIFPSVN